MLSLFYIFPLFMASTVLCYDEKFDKFDIDKVLKDETLLMSYFNCFMDKGECTAEYASEFKEILPEVIADACSKCTKIQLANFRKLFKYLYEEKRELLLEMQKKYDPKSQYKDKLIAILEIKSE